MAEKINPRKQPKVTVVTVVYNSVDLVEETIKSVLNQSYHNIEYIMIDGGSTDGTVEIIRKYEQKIGKWISEPDNGIYDAMNKAIDMASGEWINFLNAGDIFTSENTVHSLASGLSDSISVLYGDAKVSDGCSLINLTAKKFTYRNVFFWGTRAVCHQSIFVRTSMCPRYNTRYTLKAELDWYFELLTRGAQVKHLPAFVCVYALGGLSDRLFKLEMTETIKVMLRRNPFFALLHLPIFVYKLIRRVSK